MSHEPPKTPLRAGRSNRKRHLIGRGFYVALAVCLIAVGGVAASTFSQTLTTVSPSENGGDTSTTAPTALTTTTAFTPAAVHPATTITTTLPTTTTTAVQTEASLFVIPLSNQVLTYYSETPIYSQTMDNYRVHKAMDFQGEENQIVRALADGTVTAVEADPLWGGCLTIDHGGGIISIYRGLNASVTEGTAVDVGDPLGTLATVPCESAMGPHLHLEMYKNGEAFDAATILSAQLTPAK